MTTKMYSYKRERAKRLYPEPAIFNTFELSLPLGMLPSHSSDIDFPIGLLKKVTTPRRPGRPPYEISPVHAQQTARIAAQQHPVPFPAPETRDSLKGDTENLPSQ